MAVGETQEEETSVKHLQGSIRFSWAVILFIFGCMGLALSLFVLIFSLVQLVWK